MALAKALLPRVGGVSGIKAYEVMFSQAPKKAAFPISVTEKPMVKFPERPLQPLKALLPI